MALLTYSAPPSKGSTVTVTLDKALLLSLNAVTSDPWWANDFDITQAIVTLKSVPGNGKRVLTFDFTQASPQAVIVFPAHCRDNFAISKIAMHDYLGDKLSIVAPGLSSDDIALV